MYETILKIERDMEGYIFITVDDQEGWEISEDLKIQLLREIQKQLGGEFDLLASRIFAKLVLNT